MPDDDRPWAVGFGEISSNIEVDALAVQIAWATSIASFVLVFAVSCRGQQEGKSVVKDGFGGGTECLSEGETATLQNGDVRIDYDLRKGVATFSYGGKPKLKDFYAGVQLGDYVTSKQYSTRICRQNGKRLTIVNTAPNLPKMEQVFLLDGGHKFLTRVTLTGPNLKTNWIAPVVMDTNKGLDIGSYADQRVLWVPFDNDKWVSYNAGVLSGNEGTSNSVAAFYDNVSRNGIVVGAVTHDVWKVGVYYSDRNRLNVFGGMTDKNWTHDVVAHGKVTGSSIDSPLVFVGFSPDWRDLMEEYADANTAINAKLPWNKGVPFGWNSWGKIQSDLNFDKAIEVSDFVKDKLQHSGFANDGTVYINLDSYWDNLSTEQLRSFVAHAKANGQKAGIYWAPFVDWGKNGASPVPGSDLKYADIWLRDNAGKPIELDGAYAVDPTNPGTKRRIDYFIDRFRAAGFEYIKLDFLSHGALESPKHFDSSVQTGMQAYNQGMRYVVDRIGGSMFISLSIAPIFPYQYGHARRIACDTYGAASGPMSSRYGLNSATYGWWMNGRLYNFNDPDHMVFQGFKHNENVVRLIYGAIAGTVFLSGDDLTTQDGQDLAVSLLTNARINEVARMGKAFRPVEGNTGTGPSSAFVLHSGNRHFLAVFNFSEAGTYAFDLKRAGFSSTKTYSFTDLFDGSVSTAKGKLQTRLDKDYAKIFEVKEQSTFGADPKHNRVAN